MKPQALETACMRTIRYLDAYLSNELTVETTHDMLRHLNACPECAAELDARTRVRTRLRDAARSTLAPPELAVKVRQRIAAEESKPWWRMPAVQWAASAACLILVAAGVWQTGRTDSLPGVEDHSGQQAFIERISESLTSVLRVGLGDHMHCAVFRKYPKDPPTVEHMEGDLGEYKEMLPMVAKTVPPEYRVIMGHQCTFHDRKFVHFALQNGPHLVSLLISRKQDGEAIQGLVQSSTHHYQVAGFETANYVAFVVSDEAPAKNLQVAQALAPRVQEMLAKIG